MILELPVVSIIFGVVFLACVFTEKKIRFHGVIALIGGAFEIACIFFMYYYGTSLEAMLLFLLIQMLVLIIILSSAAAKKEDK